MNENLENQGSPLLSPEEVAKLKSKRRVTIGSDEEQKESTQKESKKSTVQYEDSLEKFVNKGSTVAIQFESGGRFGNPRVLVMKDYLSTHINDLITAKEDDIFETLVVVLNECVVSPANFDVGNLTAEEFYELLVGMKMAFDSIDLTFKWVHDCQHNAPEKERQLSEAHIDLRTLNFQSIETADEKLRDFYRARLGELSEEQFVQYLEKKYGKNTGMSIDEEVAGIQVREPTMIPGYDADYEFNFTRVKNLVTASKLAQKEFDPKIRIESNRSIHGMKKEEMQAHREEAIDKLNRQKAKAIITYAQALSISRVIYKDGREETPVTVEDKMRIFKAIPRKVILNYAAATDQVVYGVKHEEEIECNLCETKERRELQQWISPFNLLPLSNNTESASSRKFRDNPVIDFYF